MPLAQRESMSVWNGRLWASSADDMASQFAAVILTYTKAGFQASPMMTNQFVEALRECAKVVRKAESNTEVIVQEEGEGTAAVSYTVKMRSDRHDCIVQQATHTHTHNS